MSAHIAALVTSILISVPTSLCAAELYVGRIPPGDRWTAYSNIDSALAKFHQGDTLMLGPGTYQKTIRIDAHGWHAGVLTTIEGEPGSQVVVKGSDLIHGWKKVKPGLYAIHPWTINSEQVFIDGKLIQQVGGTIFDGFPLSSKSRYRAIRPAGMGIWPGRRPAGVTHMTVRSFYYDAAASSLYIRMPTGFRPNEHKIEVSVRTYLLYADHVVDLEVKNIQFQHANTSARSRSAAVTIHGAHVHLQNLHVSWVDSKGIALTGNYNVIDSISANHCGQLGLTARGQHLLVKNSRTDFNNVRGFNQFWEAGGAKFTGHGGLRHSRVVAHQAIGNKGDGIWFDWGNQDDSVHDSVLAYNQGHGLHYEASQHGSFSNNYVFANGRRGIYLPQSSGSVVYHNLVALNGMAGIAAIDSGRRDPSHRYDLRVLENRVWGNIFAWNGRAAKDVQLRLPLPKTHTYANHNLFVTLKGPPHFGVPGWFGRIDSLADWRSRTGYGMQSHSVVLPVPPGVMASISSKKVKVNWSDLLSLAKRPEYHFTPPFNAGTGQTNPGPLH